MTTTTDDELLALAEAAIKAEAARNWRDHADAEMLFSDAASPGRVKALIEEKRHSRYLEDEAHKEINRQATEIIDLWKRLKRAEEALRRISAVSDVGGHIAAAYFKPAGEGE